jgi:uncharacterized protein DUF4124
MYSAPDSRIFMPTIKGIVALFLAAAAAFASADTVYKYQRPDGAVIYSDAPIHGAKLIGRFELVPSPPPASPAREETPRRAAPSEDPGRRRALLDEADARLKAADRALKDAEERQQRAVEPLPGERLGNVGGKSRLTPEYFARQRAIAAEVDAARADLDQAYRMRNEVRE